MTGFSASPIMSQKPFSDTWLTSTSIPSACARLKKCLPFSVSPSSEPHGAARLFGRFHTSEIIRTPDRGQFSVNISKPGVTKGQHWHHTKNEKFVVVSGHGLIRLRKIGTDEVVDFEVSGEKIEVVEMIPGYTHNIINLSDTEELVTFMWANEPFDPNHPDTYFEEV